jgi:hypothetical protein
MSHKPAREMVERGTEPDEDTARLLLSTSVDLEQGDGPESGNDSKLAARSAPVESAASKNFMKNISLALLAVQNCAMILSMKYSKSHVAPGDKPYISTTVVVVVSSNAYFGHPLWSRALQISTTHFIYLWLISCRGKW